MPSKQTDKRISPVLAANGEPVGDWRYLDNTGDPTEPIPTGMQLGAPLDDPDQAAAARLTLDTRGTDDAPLHWEHALAIVRMRAQNEQE